MERQTQNEKDVKKKNPNYSGNQDPSSRRDDTMNDRNTNTQGRGNQNMDRPQSGGTTGQTWSGNTGGNTPVRGNQNQNMDRPQSGAAGQTGGNMGANTPVRGNQNQNMDRPQGSSTVGQMGGNRGSAGSQDRTTSSYDTSNTGTASNPNNNNPNKRRDDTSSAHSADDDSEDASDDDSSDNSA
jgi:penicillin-binding protein 1B